MRALVTGSAGFVGSRLTSMLRKQGWEVIEADRRLGNDLERLGAMRAVFAPRPDIVLHLASSVSTPGSVARPLQTFTDTVVTAANALECAREARIPVILTSSVKARDGMTPYGASKRMVEMWATEYAAAYGLTVVIDRPGTIYGPGQEGSPESGWIAWFCKARDEGLTVTINGDGSQVRDLLHVDDYCRLMLIQAAHPEMYATRIWDVGGGEDNAVSVLTMAEHMGLTYEMGPPRYGDAHTYIGENDVPGWGPTVWWKDEL